MNARTFLIHGLIAGLLAGIAAFLVAYSIGEPPIDAAIALEESNAALRLDILARKLAEEKLLQNEATLAMASRLGRLGAWIIILPTQQIMWSGEARAIHEVAADFLPTLENTIGFYTPECRPLLTEACDICAREGRPFDLELHLITSTGRPIAVRTIGEAVWGSNGKVQQIQGAIQDITDRKFMEDKVRQAQKMEAVGTLASGIAHDFNNIIAVIQGNIHKALDDLHPEHPARKNVNEIRKATHHAKNLVKQILTFSRQLPPVHSLLSVGPVLEETTGFLQASLPPGVTMVYSVAQGTPHIQADATQLHQVLLNLCTNAAHAIGEQAGRIELKAEEVVLDAAQIGAAGDLSPGRHLQLSVSDTGTGMDEATLERIFNPFFTTKEPGKGTGLGLSVVDGIIREHKGRVSVTSRPGHGTTFTILIPASEDQTDTPANENDTNAETQHGSGQHILYLDDKEDLVELSTALFESLGYRVTGFTSPASCIQAFAQNPDGFDLFITDLNMPGHSGLDVAAQLMAIKPKLGVILVSGYTDDSLTEKAHQMGIKHVVSKTSSLETMANTIHQLLVG
ncbi:MAG: CbtA family protein, partial [Pseudomonadota bacterium]